MAAVVAMVAFDLSGSADAQEPVADHRDERTGLGDPRDLGDITRPIEPMRGLRGDREIDLSKTEFELLALLVRNVGIVLDPTTIYDRIWGYDFGPDSKNLAVYIRYLRRKIETDDETQ